MGGRGLGWRALPGSGSGRCGAGEDESEAAADAGSTLPRVQTRMKGAECLRELVDGVVEVTGVRFIWEMSKSSQSSVSWAVPTRLK